MYKITFKLVEATYKLRFLMHSGQFNNFKEIRFIT